MASSAEQAVLDAATPVVAENGLYLEGVQVVRAGKRSVVRIIVDLPDGPGSVQFDQLEQVSRQLSDTLDAIDPISGAYQLEITTAGAEREIVDDRTWRRAVERQIQVQLVGGKKLIGRLMMVTADTIELQIGAQTQLVTKSTIEKARTIVVFDRPDLVEE